MKNFETIEFEEVYNEEEFKIEQKVFEEEFRRASAVSSF